MIDISVIIPTYNRKKDIGIAIRSVISQTNVSVECIIVDDLSNDGTIDYLRSEFDDPRIKVIHNKVRSGPQVSRNIGLKIAVGEYIAFLDSDDYFEPNTLAWRLGVCRKRKLDLLISNYYVRYVGSKWDLVKKVSQSSKPKPINYKEALCNFKVAPIITILLKNEKGASQLMLDVNLISGHDDDLILQTFKSKKCGYDDTYSATIIQHLGERVATPRNLLIGDAQLLIKYSEDIKKYLGHSELLRKKSMALAGLFFVRNFNLAIKVIETNGNNKDKILCVLRALYYLPLVAMKVARQKLIFSGLDIFG
jgi:glycosyltransferase involved in cell wall biosynthesis